MTLTPQTRIGPYEIIDLLGAGGMGEVYRARDTRLGRQVALKVLRPQVAENAGRAARFEQEARTAGSLSHPNIVAVYDVGREQGMLYIVTELIEGESLRALIQRGRLSVHKTTELGIQIADALAAAHAAGIVHRDLKPENIMVTREGRVKVVDFGLARQAPLAAAAGATPEQVDTLTQAGAVFGTVGYMSPEQARGVPADHRSDIFSFGAILYEMLSGRRAFERASAVETLHAVLADDPPGFPAERKVPLTLESIVRHCMEKGKEERFQSAWDLAFALEAIAGTTTTSSAAAAPVRRGRRWKWGAAAVVAAAFATGGAAAWLALRLGTAPEAQTAINGVTFAQLTDDPGAELHGALAPDGRRFAFASHASGNWDIYVQAAGTRGAVNLTADSKQDDTQPAFSPDGRWIAFRSEREGGGIFVMPAGGGPARRLSDAGYSPAWSPDGRRILFAEEGILRPEDRQVAVSRIWSVEAAGGQKRLVSAGDAVQPRWSPHGQRIAYWAIDRSGQRDLWTMPAEGGSPVPVTRDAAIDWDPVWSPDGRYLYFASNRGGEMNLWRVPMQEASGKPLGPPEPIHTPSAYSGHLSLSADGRRLGYVEQVVTSAIYRVSFDPVSEMAITEPAPVTPAGGEASRPSLSPDGQWLAFNSAGAQEDVYVVSSRGSGARQITSDAPPDRGPRWSPDGKRIAFFSKRTGNWEIWTAEAGGGDARQITFLAGPNVAWPVWSPGGETLVYTVFGVNSFALDLRKGWEQQAPRPLPRYSESGAQFSAWSWSPDGRRIAGFEQRPGGAYAGIVLYSPESGVYDKLTDYGADPVWLSDNRRLLFHHDGKLHIVDSATRRAREVLAMGQHEVARRGFAVSRDDRQIFFSVIHTEADVWMAEFE